ERVMENWDGAIQIALYLKPEVTDSEAAILRDELSQHELIEQVTLITRDEALEEYRNLSGFAEALDALEENPLPSLLLIQPQMAALSPARGEALIDELGAIAEVETAQLDRQWVKRLFIILNILQRAVVILAILLSLAVLLIIGNTIRLSITNKRTEIEINKLFGATNAFIQRPFLYSGFIFGVAGSLIAWVLLLISTSIMAGPVNQLASLYNSDFTLQGLNPGEFCILLATGGGLGLLGSWIAVGRHIRATEPT
ncbi:MAG: permease-like cell division protein FtsX, partial [Gammaproteobacteria bacterium]